MDAQREYEWPRFRIKTKPTRTRGSWIRTSGISWSVMGKNGKRRDEGKTYDLNSRSGVFFSRWPKGKLWVCYVLRSCIHARMGKKKVSWPSPDCLSHGIVLDLISCPSLMRHISSPLFLFFSLSFFSLSFFSPFLFPLFFSPFSFPPSKG